MVLFPAGKPDLFSRLALAALHLVDARSQLQQGAMENLPPARHVCVRDVCQQAQELLDDVRALVVGGSMTDEDLAELLGGDAAAS